MAVYTEVAPDALAAFLAEFDLGPLAGYRGIGQGIENTNYFVDTARGRFVLTLFESIGSGELPYYLNLMAFLAERGFPSAHPIAGLDGRYLRTLKDRPAALVRCLPGESVMAPALPHCAAIGRALGRLHRLGEGFGGHRDNARGPAWWRATAEHVLPRLDPGEAAMLADELRHQAAHAGAPLPRGVIHADLFRDNALFSNGELTGIIDFYYACNDVLLFDLAVTVNDWCTRPDGELEPGPARAVLAAYHRVRALTELEHRLWPALLRAAALRFWLSRLADRHFPRNGPLPGNKDPEEYARILRRHRAAERSGIWVP